MPAWLLFSRVANLAFIVTAIAAIIIAIFAEQIVRSEIGIAPGFGLEQQQLIAELMRLNLIATLIFSISGLVIGGLQANQHFILPALAPSLYNIGMIFGAWCSLPLNRIVSARLPCPHSAMACMDWCMASFSARPCIWGFRFPA